VTLSGCAIVPSVVVLSPLVFVGMAVAAVVAKLIETRGRIIALVGDALRHAISTLRQMRGRDYVKLTLKVLLAFPVYAIAAILFYGVNVLLFLLIELPFVWPYVALSVLKENSRTAAGLISGGAHIFSPMLAPRAANAHSPLELAATRVELASQRVDHARARAALLIGTRMN
jgi:hypothetical protein